MAKCLVTSICCMCMLQSFSCTATVLATGDATTPYTFSTAVTAKAYDTYTGTLYVGLGSAPTTASYIISKVGRPFGGETPVFTAIGTKVTDVSNVSYLALATYPGNLAPLVVYAPEIDMLVGAITYDGGKQNAITTIFDAGDEPQETDGPIIALAANRSFAFAAVPTASGTFGEPNSGIAVICVKETTDSITLTQTEQTRADGTDPQVRAKRVDNTIDQVKIGALTAPTIHNFATLHWSEYLQRLYIGLDITIAGSAAGGGKAVIVSYLDSNALLNLVNIAPDGAFDNTGFQIVGDAAPTGDDVEFSIPFIRTMHCSTGPSYLIVSGGNLTETDALTRISALPLVDNPTNLATHGTIADKSAALIDYKFITPATTVLGMPSYDDPEVMVGAGPLAMATTETISDIQVIGDTVYVSIAAVQDNVSNNGVLYSQAIFAPDGKIDHWTAWTKRAFPYRGFCDNTSCVNPECTTPPGCNAGCQPGCTSLGICDIGCQNTGVKFFAVDAANGKVWGIDGTTERIVRLTTWDRGGCISQLPCKVSEALCDGCYSVLDLDQATKGFEAGSVPPSTQPTTTPNRYAVFGGCNKVVFARVSQAIPDANNNITLQSPQQVITAFSSTPDSCTPCTTNKENFLLTQLPNAGCVNQLEYSRQTHAEEDPNYFFAGTNNGLYVFAGAGGASFNVASLTTLDQPPFATGSWFAIKEPFNVPIVAIKTTGKYLYVLTRTQQNGTIQNKLYQITFNTSLATMFVKPLLIAQTGVDPFAGVLYFSGIQPVTNGTDEQIFLTTNNGLFLSGDIAIPPDVPTWQRVPAGITTMFAGIAAMDTLNPGTVWPFSVQDPSGFGYFDRSSIFQISGPTQAPNTLTFVPADFNANSCLPAFASLDPITNFWSDGARRFFIINRNCEVLTRNRLMVLPYDVDLWHITNPAQQIITYDSFVIGSQRFFWVKQIGITGMLMVGMDRGVIALE